MKKYFIFVAVLALLASGAKTVKADDGGPTGIFWMFDHKTNCISINNPEATGDNAFLVFDYSAKTGQTLGKPWTIVKKGECYKTEDGTEAVYLVQGAERTVFSNYNNYSPTDSVSKVFCDNQEYCTGTESKYSITSIRLDFHYAITLGPSDVIHFTGITADSLFPTKYDFGEPVTLRSSQIDESIAQISADPLFISVVRLYSSLANQLNTTLQSCDNRVRIERQYNLDLSRFNPNEEYIYSGVSGLFPTNTLWQFSDNKNVSMPTDIDDMLPLKEQLNRIELIGCTTAFNAFIQSHKADFTTIDRLAENVLAKYPNAPIGLRTSTKIPETPTLTQEQQETVAPTVKEEPSPTTLDEPTPAKKLDILANSPSPFMRVYIWLPLIALAAALTFLFLTKE